MRHGDTRFDIRGKTRFRLCTKPKFAQTPNVRCSRSPTRCQMNVENNIIKSHGCGLSNGVNSSIYQQHVTKIQRPEDGVLDSCSGFFLDFLTMHLATRARYVHFLLRARTLHSCQQVVSSKSLVPLILCYIFPLLFLTEVTLPGIPSNCWKECRGREILGLL
jgi:hypothetical protein